MARWNSAANDVFLKALEHDSPSRRRAYLDKACGSDRELRSEVESLLVARAQVGDFLESPALGSAAFVAQAHVEGPGTQIGRYTLLEQIGEGGMGVVYMAEQREPVRRKVALKIVKPGMDTRQVVTRFEAERQALALMEHPHIARILDAGTTETGRPYFVMELVRGVPITEYCDAHNLPTRERLQLFMDACRAVQHAHQKGIIHRDIKPNNVLVTQQDGRPAPKIIDFGVAKATQQRLTERTFFTEHRQLVGTPEYMSPEQATFCEADVDTRSDIYSLGVLLYELLVGVTPFDSDTLRRLGYDEICRVIRESDPPTPSHRLRTLKDVAEVSKHRHLEPPALRKHLQGDLDWIVMKCLEKDRSRRYETVHSLDRDVERHLNDEPVQARPPSASYRLKKLLRKHRGPVAAGLAIAATLILGLILTSVGFLRAKWERQIATGQLYVSDVNSAYHAWQEGNVDRVRDLLERHVPPPGREDHREFAWRYLWGEYQRALKVPTIMQEAITRVTYSPDGAILASTSWDGTVKLSDTATLSELRTLKHEDSAFCVVFSPDGSLVASGGGDQLIRLWDPATGEQLAQLTCKQTVNDLAFSADGQLLAAGCGERIVGETQLWNIATRTKLASLSGHTASVASVAFSPDGKVLASGSWDRTVKLWDVESGAEFATLHGHQAAIAAVAFSPSGNTFASGGRDGSVKLWNRETREIVAEIPESIGNAICLAFSPSGAVLAVGTNDNRVWLWDVATNRTKVHRTGHSRGVRTIAFSPDRACLATGSEDGTVQIATTPEFTESISQAENSATIARLAVSPAGGGVLAVGIGGIATGVFSGELVLWDVATRQDRRLAGEQKGPVYSVCFSPDGKLLASSALEDIASWSGGLVRLWDVASGKQLRTIDAHQFPVFALAFSPDGRTLASGDWGNVDAGTPHTGDWGATIKLWDVTTGRLRRSVFTSRFAVSSIAFSPDGELLAIGGGKWDDGEVKLWDLGRDVGPITAALATLGVRDVDFSPDGRLLAIADHGGPLVLWRVTDRKELVTFNAHSHWLASITISPDGKTLASGSRDRTIRLWDVATGGELATFKTEAAIDSVEFFPDGKTLAAGCLDKSVILWHVDSAKEVLRAGSE